MIRVMIDIETSCGTFRRCVRMAAVPRKGDGFMFGGEGLASERLDGHVEGVEWWIDNQDFDVCVWVLPDTQPKLDDHELVNELLASGWAK